MEEIKYFLDTYAIIEIIKENKEFKKFQETINFTGFANLLEVHHKISKEFNEKKADEIVDKLKTVTINVELKDIKAASRFRIKHARNEFSYIDCLGYMMALNRNMRFVTGDNQFKNFENVEFVK